MRCRDQAGLLSMIEIGAGLEQAVASFEAGWLCGVRQSSAPVPGSLDPSLEPYWIDGYHAAVEEVISNSRSKSLNH